MEANMMNHAPCAGTYHSAAPEFTVSDMIASGAYRLILGVEAAWRALAGLFGR
jgi:hypothetical protein